MKILIIDSACLTWQYTKLLCDSLIKKDCVIKLVCSKKDDQDIQKYYLNFFGTLPLPKFNSMHLRSLMKFLKGINHFIGLIRLLFHVNFYKVDILHFQISPLPWIDNIFLKLYKRKCKVICTIHNTLSFHGGANFLQRIGFKSLIRNYDLCIVHSSYSKKVLEDDYDIRSDNIFIIHHPLFNKVRKINSKKYCDLDRKKINILYFGIINKYKGVDIFLRSLRFLDENILSQLDINIAGKLLVKRNSILEISKKYNLGKYVNFNFGWIDENTKEDLFENAHLVVLPYLHIDGSGVLADAFEYNLPVIASDIGSFSELIIENEMGYLFDSANEKALSLTIEKMIENKFYLVNMSQKISDLARKIDDWDVTANKILEIYSSLKK